MKHLCTLSLLALAPLFAQAADKAPAEAAPVSACAAAAKERNLHGAASTSFVTKCEREAAAKCEASASEKKLAGAAKTSHLKKCVRETGPLA